MFCHGILVVSDEIHQDFIFNQNKKHVPFASLGPEFAKNSITCTSASKTFNLAGLQCANLFIPDEKVRQNVQRQIDRSLYNKVNLLGMVATEAAYSQGEDWLRALLDYVGDNRLYFAQQVHDLIPDLKVIQADALYLAWLDCRALRFSTTELQQFMLNTALLWFDEGTKFAPQERTEGDGFMRVNLGCSRRVVKEAVARLNAALGNSAHSQHRSTRGVVETLI